MKKWLKVTLKILVGLLLLLIIAGFWGWTHLKSAFFDFEEDYAERREFKELTIEGYTFLDRNDNGKLDVYEDERAAFSYRVEDALGQMTIDEKIHLLKGSGLASATGADESEGNIPGAVGTIVPTPRLGLPTIYLSDGPAGLRIEPIREEGGRTYYCTAFPIATTLASTWNEELIHQVGSAMGKEALEYGIDVILGPGANIHRHPLTGRNFEYYSEDPHLSGYIGAAMVNGIQSHNIGTSVKHYVANNQETDRHINDVIVSERAMREIYLKGFEIIVEKSQPWTIMSSYNKVNGVYTSESKYLLTDILRDEWSFKGLVVTDWFGGRNAAAQISAGNDLLEPGTLNQWEALIEAHEDGTLSEEDINTSARRILELVFRSNKMKGYAYSDNPDLDAHAKITRQSAAEGIVLLKNEATLPLASKMNVALLGTTSYDFIAGGTGSGDVNEAYTISLEQGLNNVGFQVNQKAKEVFESHKAANPEQFVKPEGMQAMFNPYTPPEMSYSSDELSEIVKSSDIGIVTLGRNAGEGGDRVEQDDFLLTVGEAEMISTFGKAYRAEGKKLIVVLNIGGVVETASWKDEADAILLAWQGGQEGGNSVADVLSGAVNPSGKLPMTFPLNMKDHASNTNFPLDGQKIELTQVMRDMMFQSGDRPEDEQQRNKDYTHYDEGVYVGYRHFDKNALEVSYPFGYGLSYTKFDYSDLTATVENDSIRVQVSIQNTGDRAGKEVVQLYVEKMDPAVDRPVRELKAFGKTKALAPEEVEVISFSVPVKELQYWKEEGAAWALENGQYTVHLGASSRDLRQSAELSIEVTQP